ncbi:hypothetical protein D3C77_523170 [compost metagenome]
MRFGKALNIANDRYKVYTEQRCPNEQLFLVSLHFHRTGIRTEPGAVFRLERYDRLDQFILRPLVFFLLGYARCLVLDDVTERIVFSGVPSRLTGRHRASKITARHRTRQPCC